MCKGYGETEIAQVILGVDVRKLGNLLGNYITQV
jgi:hypothetical protein